MFNTLASMLLFLNRAIYPCYFSDIGVYPSLLRLNCVSRLGFGIQIEVCLWHKAGVKTNLIVEPLYSIKV